MLPLIWIVSCPSQQTPSRRQCRLLGAVYGRISGQQGAEAGDGGNGVLSQAKEVSHNALVKLYARGVYGAFMEGQELAVPEFPPYLLGLFQLPRFQLPNVQRR